jgi:hypothetical protein
MDVGKLLPFGLGANISLVYPQPRRVRSRNDTGHLIGIAA